jgi:NAD(P)-dependent dehydrogenase (short-subunit alcohol dehydrogenase family)
MAGSIVVTGGAGTVGAELVDYFALRGWNVTSLDIADHDHYRANVRSLGQVDLADVSETQAAMCAAAQNWGGIDALANIAGGFVWATIADSPSEMWQRMFTMNVLSAVSAIQASLPYLRESTRGRIINIGASSALKAATGMAPYAAAKSGIHRLTESIAAEFADSSLTCNAILPTVVDTPANRQDMPDADRSKWVSPTQIAALAYFLASDEAAAINGALLPIGR